MDIANEKEDRGKKDEYYTNRKSLEYSYCCALSLAEVLGGVCVGTNNRRSK
jgi:hypothetical protein